MKPEMHYRSHLKTKAQEIVKSLRNRGRITVEYSAEEAEQIALKDERELAGLALDRETQLLRELRAAETRLANGTFGICQDCHGKIPARRLAVLPWARRCVPCQEMEDGAAREHSPRPLSFAA